MILRGLNMWRTRDWTNWTTHSKRFENVEHSTYILFSEERLIQSCRPFWTPVAAGISEWTIPLPAVIHCISPASIEPLCPSKSSCRTAPCTFKSWYLGLHLGSVIFENCFLLFENIFLTFSKCKHKLVSLQSLFLISCRMSWLMTMSI